MSADEGVLPAVSSTLQSLSEQRKIEYSRSSIKLVDLVENKYPLADIIMKRCNGMKVNGNLEGGGSADFYDGHSYEGRFHNGVMHGQGRYKWKDGVIYEGDFTECKITGEGQYTWPDGSTYTGDVLKGLRHGHGIYHCPNTGATYTGCWVAGMREGRGKLVYDQTGLSYYEGEWVGNQQEGHGVKQYRSGNVYDGMWSNNQRHGQGTMNWTDRGERYTGEWVNGVQNGHGEHVWIVGGTDNAQYPVCNRYVGDWKDGLREGNGTYYYASGAVYSGQWVGNKKHGRGKFVFQSGKIFEGTFDCDKMDQQISQSTDRALRPKTPLGSLIGDIDSSERLAGGSVTEKFNLEISRVLPIDSNRQHELKQVHCVLLRFITQLKTIYHLYSSLGRSTQSENTMTRLQLWRLLRDCRLHHLGFTIYDTDIAIDPSSPSVHDPNTTFLMREFLQVLVFLANYIYNDRGIPLDSSSSNDRGIPTNSRLSLYLSKLISTRILPHAGSHGGLLYGQTQQHTQVALEHKDSVWIVFEKILTKSSGQEKCVRVRDILLLVQACGLITSTLTASKVTSLLVCNDPLAYNEGYYNMEIKVTFLEFFEALLKCAVEWSKSPEDPSPVSVVISHETEAISIDTNCHATIESDPLSKWSQSLQGFFGQLLPKALC